MRVEIFQKLIIASGLLGCLIALPAIAQRGSDPEVWIFDNLENIGGIHATALGHPHVIDSSVGKAVQFNGVDDALYIDEDALTGVDHFTVEAIFRPESGGAPEQRWFHLSEQDPTTKADTDNRYLFEIRVVDNKWALDSYAKGGPGGAPLLNIKSLYPLDQWYAVEMVYDGSEFRNYINGELQGKAPLHIVPHGPGHTSVGVRINKINYFKGSVREAKFTHRALTPDEFMKVPVAH